MGSEWKPSRNRWSETELVKWWLERAESYGNWGSALKPGKDTDVCLKREKRDLPWDIVFFRKRKFCGNSAKSGKRQNSFVFKAF